MPIDRLDRPIKVIGNRVCFFPASIPRYRGGIGSQQNKTKRNSITLKCALLRNAYGKRDKYVNIKLTRHKHQKDTRNNKFLSILLNCFAAAATVYKIKFSC